MTPQELETLLKENFKLRVEISHNTISHRIEYESFVCYSKKVSVNVQLQNLEGKVILEDFDSYMIDSRE